MKNILMKTQANKLPIYFCRGEGVWLYDKSGQKYLDAISGLGVTALGHSNPVILKTILDQVQKVIHTSDSYYIEEQEKLAEKLCELSGMEQVGFVNSGAEANEVAIKLTRVFAKKRNILDPLIIKMNGAFHGHTLAATSAAGVAPMRKDFEPFLSQFISVPFNCVKTLEDVVRSNKNIVAILLEPIQGDGGIQIATNEYLQAIRNLCDTHDLLMMVDEVQCGMGRTGKWFAFQHANCIPDIITMAKALANGIPIGVCLSRGKAYDLFVPKQHGSTFGGNPLSCRTALSVLNTFEETQLLVHVQKMGNYLLSTLQNALLSLPHVTDIRGRGLMIGIEMDEPCEKIMQIGLKHHLLLNVVQDKVIRLLPPLIITEEEADLLCEKLKRCIEDHSL